MEPYHAKVVTLFDRIMAQDNSYVELFRTDAVHILWFEGGKAGTPADIQPFPRPGGPLQYWNRSQYFGDHFFAEAHTAAYVDKDACDSEMLGKSMEVLAVCQMDDDGYITHFEEFGDMAFLQKEEGRPPTRAIPSPARPPNDIVVVGANSQIQRQVQPWRGKSNPGPSKSNPGAVAARNKSLVNEFFDRIMLFDDLDDMFTDTARSAQMFAGKFWDGKYFEGGDLLGQRNKETGVMRLGPERPVYTARRQFAGVGFAIELHSVTLSPMLDKPAARYKLEMLGVVTHINDDGKIDYLVEYADPSASTRRVEDDDGRPVAKM